MESEINNLACGMLKQMLYHTIVSIKIASSDYKKSISDMKYYPVLEINENFRTRSQNIEDIAAKRVISELPCKLITLDTDNNLLVLAEYTTSDSTSKYRFYGDYIGSLVRSFRSIVVQIVYDNLYSNSGIQRLKATNDSFVLFAEIEYISKEECTLDIRLGLVGSGKLIRNSLHIGKINVPLRLIDIKLQDKLENTIASQLKTFDDYFDDLYKNTVESNNISKDCFKDSQQILYQSLDVVYFGNFRSRGLRVENYSSHNYKHATVMLGNQLFPVKIPYSIDNQNLVGVHINKVKFGFQHLWVKETSYEVSVSILHDEWNDNITVVCMLTALNENYRTKLRYSMSIQDIFNGKNIFDKSIDFVADVLKEQVEKIKDSYTIMNTRFITDSMLIINRMHTRSSEPIDLRLDGSLDAIQIKRIVDKMRLLGKSIIKLSNKAWVVIDTGFVNIYWEKGTMLKFLSSSDMDDDTSVYKFICNCVQTALKIYGVDYLLYGGVNTTLIDGSIIEIKIVNWR